jgi:hypothetical protein
MKKVAPFLILLLIASAAVFVQPETMFSGDEAYNSADIAWILISAALVFLMTPGLAFFYGGMVNSKNVISTMIKSFVSTAVFASAIPSAESSETPPAISFFRTSCQVNPGRERPPFHSPCSQCST